jgi:hypothetical protein
MAKYKTNEDKLKSLLKNNHPILNALLVERILKIAEITEEAIKESPESFCNPIIHYSVYLELIKNIKKELA